MDYSPYKALDHGGGEAVGTRPPSDQIPPRI